MKPYQVTMLGLGFDIIGAFLVSVEAIRLDNLRVLRTKILEPLHTATLSPKLVVTDDALVGTVTRSYMIFYNGLHYLAGILFLVLVNYLLHGLLLFWFSSFVHWLSTKRSYVILLLGLICVVYGIFAGLWMLGELIHMGITQLTRWPIPILEFIDARTPNGTIGIIGFAFLFLGFILQMWAAYLSRPATG
jgi:hypothetical protein